MAVLNYFNVTNNAGSWEVEFSITDNDGVERITKPLPFASGPLALAWAQEQRDEALANAASHDRRITRLNTNLTDAQAEKDYETLRAAAIQAEIDANT